MNYTLGESLHNTTGTIRRCGQLRIEIVVLLATLLNIAIPEVITFYREYDVMSRVVVGRRISLSKIVTFI